jgi:monoamine oxidase
VRLTRRELLVASGAVALSSCRGEPTPSSAPRDPFTPRRSLVTRWDADPFARGSYSFLAAGATSDQRDLLLAPVDDTLLFAGEHTWSPAPSTTHGALESGRAAAQAVIDADVASKVLVIGAGFAGLGAAQALVAAELDVLVIEARDRVGGRAWTSREWGFPIDLGASWIHGIDDNPIAALADEVGAVTSVSDGDRTILFDADGALVDTEEMFAAEAIAAELLERELDGATLGEGLAAALDEEELDERTRRLVEVELHRVAEHELSGGLDELNVDAWHEGEAIHGDEVVLPRGYGPLAERLTARLTFAFDQIVDRVEWGDGVRVIAGAAVFEADAVIVTLPLGVLKAGVVTFDPPLPDEYTAVIDALGVGLLDKVILEFDQPFWPDDVEMIGFTREDGRFIEWLNLGKHTGRSVLVGFTAAAAARELEQLDDAAVVAAAVDVLRGADWLRSPS